MSDLNRRDILKGLTIVGTAAFGFGIPTVSHAAGIIPNIGKQAHICLQSWMGTFVCAENGGGGIIVANRPEAKEWETFEINRIDADHVTLRTNNGHFVCAEHGGGAEVVTNRKAADIWETFGLFVDQNGLVSLAAHNGLFVCAESSGIVVANRSEAKEWEKFRIVDPASASLEQTRIEVNVYKIGIAPFWHTGTVIARREYYFQTNNKVETCNPKGMELTHHRTIARLVPGNEERLRRVLHDVIARWNGTRYDVAGHNCNFFTNDLLHSLGALGLDQEYLDASGLAKGLRQLPGGAFFQEALVKWPITDKRMDQAAMEDLRRASRLPEDTAKAIEKAGEDTVKAIEKAGEDTAKGTDHVIEEAGKVLKKLKIP